MENKNKKIELRFVGIQVFSKQLTEKPSSLSRTPVFHFEIQVKSKVQAEKKLIISMVDINISEKDKSLILGKASTGCIFKIEDFQNVIKKNDEDDLYFIPEELQNLIRPVAISTARGIIYSEFKGTYLNNAILPIIGMETVKYK